MKAAAFDYVRAASINEAIQLLARNSERTKLLAGGQSLLPALDLRLMAPELLIDISGAAELRTSAIENGMARIGTLTRHADPPASPAIAQHAPLLSKTAGHIAHPAIGIRSRIGGSPAHSDPAAAMPDLKAGNVVSPTKDGELGTKGAGEAGTAGAAARVANAVNDALAPFGALITAIPLSPEHKLRAIGRV